MSTVQLSPYLKTIKRTLESLFGIELLDSQAIERQSRPEFYALPPSPEMLSFPVVIAKNNYEKTMIESAVNGIRISICLKKSDELEKWIYSSFFDFLQKRAFNFVILCKQPQPGYDITFLVSAEHIDRLLPYKIVDFILFFIQEVDKNMSHLKLQVNARARSGAEEFVNKFD